MKTLEIIDFDNSFYDELSFWWESWGWNPVPLKFLPKGFIVSDGIKKYAAGFIYYTDNNIAWLEWVVSNPENSNRESYISIKMIVEHIKKISKVRCDAIFTSVISSGLVKLYQKCGFKITDCGAINMIGGI